MTTTQVTPAEITTEVGRIVGGHPMEMIPQVDDRTNQPKMSRDGTTQLSQAWFHLAIPKNGTTHWAQTEWGSKIWQKGAEDWPAGQSGQPGFAWKIEDGDDTTTSVKRRVANAMREGYPGHWIIRCQTGIPIKCYHAGKYDPTQQIQNPNEVKTGDYARVVLMVKSNGDAQSPGMYINPSLLSLERAGVAIITAGSGPAASEAFAQPAQLPAGAQVDPNPAPGAMPPPAAPGAMPPPAAVPGAAPGAMPPPAAPGAMPPPAAPGAMPSPAAVPGAAPVPSQVVPAQDFLTPAGTAPAPELKYNVGGQVYTAAQLKQSYGWTDEQIATLPPAS